MRSTTDLLIFREHGTVTEIKQDVIHVTGLTNCMNGQLVSIAGHTDGVVLGFDDEYVLVLVVDEGGTIKPGDRVEAKLEEFRVPVGDAFLGRRVNALCKPIDGLGAIPESDKFPIFGVAPGVLERVPLSTALEMGTKIADMILPVGLGQRMLVLGDRMTGKTSLCLDAIVNQKGKNIFCIYCCIGKSDSALTKVADTFSRCGVWDYGMILAATAADPVGQQYLAPYVAASLGEYFMQQGRDVLVVFDDCV